MTRRRALASACAAYGRATVAQALAHLAKLPPGARVSIRGAGHRAVVTRADGTRDASANVGAWVPLIPRHVEDCPECSRLACEAVRRAPQYRAAMTDPTLDCFDCEMGGPETCPAHGCEAERFEALGAYLEPTNAID